MIIMSATAEAPERNTTMLVDLGHGAFGFTEPDSRQKVFATSAEAQQYGWITGNEARQRMPAGCRMQETVIDLPSGKTVTEYVVYQDAAHGFRLLRSEIIVMLNPEMIAYMFDSSEPLLQEGATLAAALTEIRNQWTPKSR